MNIDIDNLLRLRTTVAALGQKDGAGWWSCTFLTPIGERFLSTPFPRSAFWAALHSTAVAASRHHDDKIGTGGTIHLFRLGPELELKLRDRVLRGGWSMEESWEQDRLSASLKDGAEVPDKSLAPGPVRLSDPGKFTGSKNLARLAGLYAAAFDSGIQIHPYGSEK